MIIEPLKERTVMVVHFPTTGNTVVLCRQLATIAAEHRMEKHSRSRLSRRLGPHMSLGERKEISVLFSNESESCNFQKAERAAVCEYCIYCALRSGREHGLEPPGAE